MERPWLRLVPLGEMPETNCLNSWHNVLARMRPCVLCPLVMNGKGIRGVRWTADEAYTVQSVKIIIKNNAALSFLF
jgi:hypothetical protein